MVWKTPSEGVRRLSLALGLIGALPGCFLTWLQWDATHDRLELAESRYQAQVADYPRKLEAWNVLPEARKLAVQAVEDSTELGEEVKSRLVERLLEGFPTGADLAVEDKLDELADVVVARILAQVPMNEGRLDGRAFTLHAREELKKFRREFAEPRKDAHYDLYRPFNPERKSSIFRWVPNQQPEQPDPPEPGSVTEYLWPLIFPLLGFFFPWFIIRSIAWIVAGFLADRQRKNLDRP